MKPGIPATIASVLTVVLTASLTFAAVAFAGLVILILLFRLGAAGSIDILFYRGIVLCGVAFILTTALVAYVGHVTKRVSLREAMAAGFLSLGLNLSFLVIAPVTLDRSISIFLLGYMAAHNDQSFTAGQMEAAFRNVYLDELKQIDRRMNEQRQSGNVHLSNGAYTISRQGMSVVTWARRIGWLFGVEQCLLDPQSSDRPCGTGSAVQHDVAGVRR